MAWDCMARREAARDRAPRLIMESPFSPSWAFWSVRAAPRRGGRAGTSLRRSLQPFTGQDADLIAAMSADGAKADIGAEVRFGPRTDVGSRLINTFAQC